MGSSRGIVRFGVLFLAWFLVSSSFGSAADQVVTIGQNKTFSIYGVNIPTETGIDTPGTGEQGTPTILDANSDGRKATAHVLAQTYQDGFARATAGVDFTVAPDGHGTRAMDATITMVLSYKVKVDFQVPPPSAGGGGSADAYVYSILPGDQRTIDGAGFVHDSDTYQNDGTTIVTTEAVLQAGQRYSVLAQVYAHAGAYIGGYGDSLAEVSITQVSIRFRQPPHVKVTVPPFLVLFNPSTWSPKDWLVAQANPPGGTYQWTIVNGQDKVRLLSVTGDRVQVQALAPSGDWNDVTIKVTYTHGLQTGEATGQLTVRKPTSLRITKYRESHWNPGWVYQVYYLEQVYDHLNQPLDVEGLTVSENRTKICSNYPSTISFDSGSNTTNARGAFLDQLSLPVLPLWKPYPPDFVIKVQQLSFLGGWHLGTFCQTYGSTTATVQPGACGSCK
jgi:hypothetical protein